MMKKSLLIILVILVVTVAGFMFNNLTKEEGFKITLHNNLTEGLNNIAIEYPGGSEQISLKGKSRTTIRINPDNQFSEGEITFNYLVKDQSNQSELIFGYIEPGYSGKAKIVIKSVLDTGLLELEIDSNVEFY